MTFIVLIFVMSFSWSFLFIYGQIFLLLFLIVLLAQAYFLKVSANKIKINREVVDKLSLGDLQNISYTVSNCNKSSLRIELIDELPFQLQFRDSIIDTKLGGQSTINYKHEILPLERGSFLFGRTSTYIRLPLFAIVSYRKIINNMREVKVYPSIIQMQKYEMKIFSKSALQAGVRRVRKIGESDEFEHIRPYLHGDNIKSINWKATSRRSQLVVNQYQNTRSQSVYCVIDKGRSMQMPFFGMTLLDHSINSALVLVNIILRKNDQAGLVTFSNRIGSLLSAKSISSQLENISQRLYNQKTEYHESNFELLYYSLRKQISKRSILLFYTNFEHQIDLDRNLKYLRLLSKKHLLVIIMFVNTELSATKDLECKTISDVYLKTISTKAIKEKEDIAHQLRVNGIQSILTKPEDLNINVINKYLEIKSKLMI